MFNLPDTISTLGHILIAFTVLRVHHRLLREHKIDKKVFSEIKSEQAVGLLGVSLIIIGYLMRML